jgi:hypothetical protein
MRPDTSHYTSSSASRRLTLQVRHGCRRIVFRTITWPIRRFDIVRYGFGTNPNGKFTQT